MLTNTSDVVKRHRIDRGPAWRWRLAKEREAGQCSDSMAADKSLVDACAYHCYLRCQVEPMKVSAECANIAQAVSICHNVELVHALMVLVVGNCPPAMIAERMMIDPTVLNTWEALFFDIRPLLGATDWIVVNVINQGEKLGNGRLAARLRAALAGGPSAAVAVLEAASAALLKRGATLLEKQIQLSLKMDDALQRAMDPHILLREYNRLEYYGQRIELAKRHFEHQCTMQLAKHRARLEREAQREQERAQKREQAEKYRAALKAPRVQGLHALGLRRGFWEPDRPLPSSGLTSLRWTFSKPRSCERHDGSVDSVVEAGGNSQVDVPVLAVPGALSESRPDLGGVDQLLQSA